MHQRGRYLFEMDIENTNSLPDSDSKHHALNLVKALTELAEHAREDIHKVNDARGRVLFETTADVLLGLARAHQAFVDGEEAELH